MPLEKRPDHDPTRHHGQHGHDRGDFFGLDVDSMSPRAQVTTSLAVLIPVAIAGVAVLTLFSNFWWLIFVFGWTVFPAFGLLVRGIAGLSEGQGKLPSGPANSRERELLGALRDRGELTPAQAAMETSLSVEEADGMLRKLAEGGHLQVRVHGGGLFYSLWETEDGTEAGQLEGR
jgi:hypothetical protein